MDMKKLMLLLLLLVPILVLAQEKTEYNIVYKYGADPKLIITNFIKLKIYQKEDRIIIENYFKDTGGSLSLIVDKLDKNKSLVLFKRKDNAPWYYCHDDLGYKYVLIGLYTQKIDLYTMWSELEVQKETFE